MAGTLFASRPKVLPNAASILVTENCNLACTYCFEIHNTRKMTIETARKSLEFLCNNAVASGEDQFHAMIFGGEPLLNVDVVEEIFRYGYELAQKNNITFVTNIITNATVMSERIKNMLIEWRDKCNLTVQLSVDGKEEVHDMYRITKTGKGSFKLIEKNIPIFKEIFKDCPRRLSIHGCLNKNSLPHLHESFEFFRNEWGFKNIWFLPVIEEDWSYEDVKIYDRETEKIYNVVLDTIKKSGDIADAYDYAPMDRCMDAQIRPGAPCGAGKTFVTISADGEIYPCHQIYFNDPEKDTIIGNVYTGIDEPARTMYIDYSGENLNCTVDCENIHCFRCLASNFVYNGSIFSQIQGVYCSMSGVDRKYQAKLRYDLFELGLLKQGESLKSSYQRNAEYSSQDNCSCDCEEEQGNCGCKEKQGSCAEGTCDCCEDTDFLEEIDKDAPCLCNVREAASPDIGRCDIVASRVHAMPGNNPNNPDCLCDSRSSAGSYNPGGNMNTYHEQETITTSSLKCVRDDLEQQENQFIDGSIDEKGRRLIEVRVKNSALFMKYEHVDTKELQIEIKPYDGDLPEGYVETYEVDLIAPYREEGVMEEPAQVGNEFEEVASLALKTILEKLISIEERLDRLEKER